MQRYDAQLVCLNGHQITDTYHQHPEYRKEHCDRCGEKTIYKCPNCTSEIKGDVYDSYVVMSISIPSHCDNCGKPYPWTEKKKESNGQKGTNKKVDSIALVENICLKFHTVVKQLQGRYDGRQPFVIKDEYDVQDLLHALLKIHFDYIVPEDYSSSHAGSASRIDFVLKDEGIVIEVKKTRPGLNDKKLGEELIVDSQRYQKHKECKNLICFVYDPDYHLKNPKVLEKDLSKTEGNLTIKVIIVPKV